MPEGRDVRRLLGSQDELFTATLGQLVLSDPRVLGESDASMAVLWRWHLLAANEHRHGAFDVYQLAGGTHFERSWVMPSSTLVLFAKVIEYQLRMMKSLGVLLSSDEWRQFLSFVFVKPGTPSQTAREWWRYFAKDFHPSAAPMSSTTLPRTWPASM